MSKIAIINSSSFKFLPKSRLERIVKIILEDFKKTEYQLNFIYLDNKGIHELNLQYLDHDYPTDVITFEIEKKPLLAEIYIGVEVAKEQSNEYKVSLTNELLRLGIHGTLHLCGFDDKTDDEKAKMRKFENKYLEYARKNS